MSIITQNLRNESSLVSNHSDKSFDSLLLECDQLELSLLILKRELNKTGELLKNLSLYLQKSHIIKIPRDQKLCEIMIGEQNE